MIKIKLSPLSQGTQKKFQDKTISQLDPPQPHLVKNHVRLQIFLRISMVDRPQTLFIQSH
jgi:hypothetical protein